MTHLTLFCFFSLQDLRNKIEELKEKELSLDDMDDECSSYIMEEKYQKKFVKVWNKLCELKQKSAATGRPSERRFKYSGMSFKGRSHRGRMVVEYLQLFMQSASINTNVSSNPIQARCTQYNIIK